MHKRKSLEDMELGGCERINLTTSSKVIFNSCRLLESAVQKSRVPQTSKEVELLLEENKENRDVSRKDKLQ